MNGMMMEDPIVDPDCMSTEFEFEFKPDDPIKTLPES